MTETAAPTRLWFTHNGRRLIGGVELRNGRANAFGWSAYEVWRVRPEPYPGAVDEEKIADLYCGRVINLKDGYGFEEEK